MSMAPASLPPVADGRPPRRWSRVRYRIKQFWLGVGAALSAEDWALVRATL